jgi:hypothetical protein
MAIANFTPNAQMGADCHLLLLARIKIEPAQMQSTGLVFNGYQ